MKKADIVIFRCPGEQGLNLRLGFFSLEEIHIEYSPSGKRHRLNYVYFGMTAGVHNISVFLVLSLALNSVPFNYSRVLGLLQYNHLFPLS